MQSVTEANNGYISVNIYIKQNIEMDSIPIIVMQKIF